MRDCMNKAVSIVLLGLLAAPSIEAADDPAREQSHSMVMTQYGVVATLQAVASQAGAAILARGGSAVDAAIAANAALSVIEPMMNGVGGDLSPLSTTRKRSISMASMPAVGRRQI
jgi:gamma-glutamyltranspeptidase/glutathione hydrolase